VKITGTDLRFVKSVNFGEVSTTDFVVTKAGKELAVITPAKEVVGIVNVTVTTGFGTTAVTTATTYKYMPVITGVFSNQGLSSGNEIVEIRGFGFAPGLNTTIMRFGTTKSKEVLCNTTLCEVVTPPHAAEAVDVKAVVNKVSSAKTEADRFTYF